jgi:hypothetical protein
LLGVTDLTLSLSVDSTLIEKPEKVACGAPLMVAEVGLELVITQRFSTTVENDQSLPTFSSSVMSNSVPAMASAVSWAAAGPIAFTDIEKVMDCGFATTPTWVRSMLCSGSAVVAMVGMKDWIGLISCSPVASV